jgi:hypothetical protein
MEVNREKSISFSGNFGSPFKIGTIVYYVAL